jgi:hypothetical protein
MPVAERHQELVDCKTGTSSGGSTANWPDIEPGARSPSRVLTWAGGPLK